MFSNKKQLQRRTPENGTGRENYLSLLVDEYVNSESYDAKCQVLANLANFAYDPINYGYIRDVGVLDIFLYVLKNETDNKLLKFACAGICNVCTDQSNAEYIQNWRGMGLSLLTRLLNSDCDEIVGKAITTLIYLCNNETKTQINTPDVIDVMVKHRASSNKMLHNLATIFLDDVCNTD